MRNFKKYAAFALIFVAAAAIFTGCKKVKSDTSPADVDESSDEYYNAANESIPDEQTQPDPLDVTAAPTTKEEEQTSTEAESSTASEEETTAESEKADETVIDANGAVKLKVTDSVSDAQLLTAGQIMFDSACKTNWNYHVGCPYDLDYQTYTENELGWQFYLITDPRINSFADIENDYFKVFSSAVGSDLNELYLEKDGKVYAMDGGRGSDIFYDKSVVSAVKQRSGNEIVFTVDNYFSGNDYGDSPYVEKEDFSVIVSDDGSWRAGTFKLPY